MSKRTNGKKFQKILKIPNKEVRKVIDWMKSLADPPESFEVTQNGHYKVRFSRYNRSGEPVSFLVFISRTPSVSGGPWSKSVRSNVRQYAVMNDVDLGPDYKQSKK